MIAINEIPYFFIVSLLRNVGKALIRSFRLFFILAPSFYIPYFTTVLALRQFSKIVSRETILRFIFPDRMFHVKHFNLCIQV